LSIDVLLFSQCVNTKLIHNTLISWFDLWLYLPFVFQPLAMLRTCLAAHVLAYTPLLVFARALLALEILWVITQFYWLSAYTNYLFYYLLKSSFSTFSNLLGQWERIIRTWWEKSTTCFKKNVFFLLFLQQVIRPLINT